MGLLRDTIAAAILALGGTGAVAVSTADMVARPPMVAINPVAPATSAPLTVESPYRVVETAGTPAPLVERVWFAFPPTATPAPPSPAPPAELVAETRPPPPPAAAIPLLPPVLFPSDADLQAALARSAWPPALWPRIVAIADCESSLNPAAIGDHGLAWGILQVRSDAHPALVVRYDVFTIDGALAAAWVIYWQERPDGSIVGFSPWSCAR